MSDVSNWCCDDSKGADGDVGSMDSIQDGSVALCTPHTSFADPTAPKDAKPRESIEIRALVFYD